MEKIYREWPSNGKSDLTINEYMEEQSKIRQIAQDKMQTNVAKTKYDNSSRINRHFNIGEKVLVKKDVYTKDEGEIIEKRHDRSYTIKMRNGKIMTRNVEWLREYK